MSIKATFSIWVSIKTNPNKESVMGTFNYHAIHIWLLNPHSDEKMVRNIEKRQADAFDSMHSICIAYI